jgi:hypothetical protein
MALNSAAVVGVHHSDTQVKMVYGIGKATASRTLDQGHVKEFIAAARADLAIPGAVRPQAVGVLLGKLAGLETIGKVGSAGTSMAFSLHN